MGYRLTTSVGQSYVESGAFVSHAIERFRRVIVERRAFCPGASPPDNSCSPANKGAGKAIVPPPAKPDSDAMEGQYDPRSEGGYSKKARAAHLSEVRDWLQDSYGVRLNLDRILPDAPSMPAIRAIADGVAKLAEAGMQDSIPREIVMADTAAPAAYNFGLDRIIVDPDFSQKQQDEDVRSGYVAGVPGDTVYCAMVHEVTHRDHMYRVGEIIARPTGAPTGRFTGTWSQAEDAFRNMTGNPFRGFDGSVKLASDPWDVKHRLIDSSPLDSAAAKQTAKKVSEYAMETPLEFVAEVRTGVASGLDYDDDVMKLYEAYGGPSLPTVARKKKAA